MSVVGEAFVRVRPQTTGFQSEASKGILGGVRRLATQIGVVLGGATLGKALFVDPIKSAAEFQRTLNVLQAQTGATDAQMKSVSATAIRLGADIKLPGTSAGDAAQAMFELSKAGLSVRESQAAVRGVLVASTAAQIDNAQAAEIVANALNAFGLRAREATRVSDLLAASANASASDIPNMALALQQVGASAHALHVPVEDTVTALAELANAGIRGSDAGTSLKTAFQRLIPTTAKAKQAMADLNVQAFDQQGRFVGLQEVSRQFQEGLKGLTDQQKAQRIQAIFGSDAQRAANIVFAQGDEVFAKLKGRVTEVGAAQKIATAQSKGLSGAWSALQSTIETLQLRLGLVLLPILTKVALAFAEDLPRAFNAAGRFAQGVIDRIEDVANSMTRTQGIVLALAAAFAVFASPITVLAGLAAAAIYLYQSFQPIAAVVDAVAGALDSNRQAVVAVTGGLLAGVAAFRTMSIIIATTTAAARAFGIAIGIAGAQTAAAATEVGVATRAATALNPLLLAISVGVGLVTAGFLSNTHAVTGMDTAYKSATAAVQGLTDVFQAAKRAADEQTFAQHSLHAAQTSLIAAQQNYRKVQADTSATELQRRQALDQLRSAEDGVKRAQNQLTDSTDANRKAHEKARNAYQGTRNAVANLTDATARQVAAAQREHGITVSNERASQALAKQLVNYANRAETAAFKSGNLASDLNQTRLQSANAARQVALLALSLNRLPTHKEIRITETTVRQVTTIEQNRLNRQHGGAVLAGVPYIVGERRPELFIPEANGRILPRVPQSVSQRGDTVNFNGPVTVVADTPGDFIAWADAAARRRKK